uniref:Uncharacterized protein n=1 Tax=Anopheles merus TaxID=30066 RepID=A0A182VGF7_ANOME
MSSGDNDLAAFDGRRIQREVSDERTQQVASVVGDSALLATSISILKQPVNYLDNRQQQQPDEWATVQHHAIISTHRANVDRKSAAWPPGSSLHAGESNATSAQYVEHSEPRALTEGNGVLASDGSLLNAAPHTDSGKQVIDHSTSSGSGSNSVMRDPQESHHRAAPPAAPLGEVESGEDDSDCVVVPSTERKVEPLKINLARDREPIRTVIKLTSGAAGSGGPDHFQQLSPTIRDVPGSPKITIKPPKPPPSMVADNPSISGLAAAASSSAGSSATLTGTEHHGNNCVSYSAVLPAYSSIPKLTIKPIINPADEPTATEGSSSATGTAAAASVEQMHIIPKLLIKGSASSLEASHGRDGAVEPHIVPKLTIRGVNNHNHHHHHHQQQSPQDTATYPGDGLASVGESRGESSGTGSPTPLVPKLTIKMDNHHPHHHHHHHHHNSLRVKEAADGVEAGVPGGPIPKLHIKTNQQDGTTTAVNSSLSAGANCSTSATLGSSPVLTSLEGVKVTIKPLPEPPKLPKLTIKTTGLGTVAETSDVSMVSSTSNSFSPKLLPSVVGCSGEQLQHHSIGAGGAPGVSLLLQQHQSQQPASPSDQHSNISSSSIPKLTIKPMPPKETTQNCSAEGSSAGTAELPPTVPKLTIKPILPPAKQSGEDSSSSSETSINSLESSPISSCSSAPTSAAVTTSPSTALRMTIKVPSSAPHQQQQQQHETNPVGHSASTALAESPTSSAAAGGAAVVTRLNIKPILPPPPQPNAELMTGTVHTTDRSLLTSDDGDSTPPSCDDSHKPIVIPKVTIKTLANPRGQETEILSTPKVTLKPIPKPQDDAAGSPVERHPPLANNTGHSPTNSAAAGMPDGTDSPRIILKINKGSSTTSTTSAEQLEGAAVDAAQPTGVAPAGGSISILANELKRPAASAMGGTATLSSSGSSSSVSCASSSSVSASATSSSAGSDPASPSSGGGGDQGEPGSPEVKKSKLDHTQLKLSQQMQDVLEQQKGLLRQSMLQSQHQYQLQTAPNAELTRRQPAAPTGATMSKSAVADVIVIDDDSKSENEAPRQEGGARGKFATARAPHPSAGDPLALNDRELAERILTLESLLRGGSKPSAASLSGGGSSFYSSVPMAAGGGGGGEVEKNGTASNSSIGSVTSSVSSSVAVPALATPAAVASGRTPAAGVRMSTRRGAGQLLKDALSNKHQDRDSGVDEARTDGECGGGATPSKRPRGRPKKQSVDLATETNGGGNSNSVDGSTNDNNVLLAMAMMGGADGGPALLRPEDRALLGAQQLMEGIMPLPRTPARTPRLE